MVAFWVAVAVLYVASSIVDEKTMHPFVKPFMWLSYPVLRYSRIMALPFHNYYNLTEYYSSECLVQNPWFDDSPDSCWHCRNKKKINEISPKGKTFWRDDFEVALYRESIETAYGFSSFQKMFEENKSVLQSELRAMTIASNRPEFKSLSDIFEKPNALDSIINDKGFAFSWHTMTSLTVNRIIRQFFGRPKFLGPKTETSIHKTIVIQGPSEKPFVVPIQHEPVGWYIQVEGTRTVRVIPSGKCSNQCRSYEVTLKPRDAVVFVTISWSLELAPFSEKAVSIGYVGHFVPF